MTETSDSGSVTASWEAYWQGAASSSCADGGVRHPACGVFWTRLFASIGARHAAPRIIDIASGDGAVVDSALRALGEHRADVTCADHSIDAIKRLLARFPSVRGLVADARSMPLGAGGFDVATSQFGVEYAGLSAIDEMIRLIAPGGSIALLLHHRAGGVYRECAAGLDAVRRLQEARFVPYAIEMFEAAFAAYRGADRAPYDAAAQRLLSAYRVAESIMQEHGAHVAGDTLLRLYNDVDRIHTEIRRYAPDDVLDWLRRMDQELPAYAERLASMCGAALDDEAFAAVRGRLRAQAFRIERAGPLLAVAGSDLPLAWALVATRRS